MRTVFSSIVVCLVMVTLAFAAPATTGISPQDVSGKPGVFCKVTKEPDPLLMGGWRCVMHRYDMKLHKYVDDSVEYWLVKQGDQYGLYFFRIKPGEKTYKGWRECTINGGVITSRTGFKISVQNGEVFYSWGGDKPTKMTRIEGS
jgi:hypothetical protein